MRRHPELIKMVQLAAGIAAENYVSKYLELWLPDSLSGPLDPLVSYIFATALIIIGTDRIFAFPTIVVAWRDILTQDDAQGPQLTLTHNGVRGDQVELHVSILGSSWLARRVRKMVMRSGSRIIFWLDPDFTRLTREAGTTGATDGRKLYMEIRRSAGNGEAKLGWAAIRVDPWQASAVENLTCHYEIEVPGRFAWLARLRFNSSDVKTVRLTRR